MSAIARRGYVYLVCGLTLQASTWAAISLLRSFLDGSPPALDAIAFRAAILVVCLPVFAAHWAWAQRAAAAEAAERWALQRWVYLYLTLALFLAPFLSNAISLLAAALGEALGVPATLLAEPWARARDLEALAPRNVAAMLVLGLLWLYHARLARAETGEAPPLADLAALRLAYGLGFALIAGALAAYAGNGVLRWGLYQLSWPGPTVTAPLPALLTDLARLLVLLPAWALAWTWARAVARRDALTARSILWPIYGYFVIAVAALVTLANLALILRGMFRLALSLPAAGDIRGPLPVVVIAGLVWAYHVWYLSRAAASSRTGARAAQVRQVFAYIMAGVGLAAAVVGAAGLLGVLGRVALTGAFDPAARERLAWAAAALVAGLPLWAWAWRSAQRYLSAAGDGRAARVPSARRVYQALWQVVGVVMTVTGGVYLVYRVLAVLLGAPPPDDVERRLADALALVAVGLPLAWYHARGARLDRARDRQRVEARLAELRPLILATGDGSLARLLAEGLSRALPGLTLPVASLGPVTGGAEMPGEPGPGPDEVLAAGPDEVATAGLLITSWEALTPAVLDRADPALAAALAASPARRIVVPMAAENLDWAGVSPMSAEEAAKQALAALLQVAGGEAVAPESGLRLVNVLAWIGGAVVALVLGLWLVVEVLGR